MQKRVRSHIMVCVTRFFVYVRTPLSLCWRVHGLTRSTHAEAVARPWPRSASGSLARAAPLLPRSSSPPRSNRSRLYSALLRSHRPRRVSYVYYYGATKTPYFFCRSFEGTPCNENFPRSPAPPLHTVFWRSFLGFLANLQKKVSFRATCTYSRPWSKVPAIWRFCCF